MDLNYIKKMRFKEVISNDEEIKVEVEVEQF
jgi:hypothetical protein